MRAGVSHLQRQQGLLYGYASPGSRAEAQAAQALRRMCDVRLDDADAAWLRGFAPLLSPDFRFGVFFPRGRAARGPGRLV